MQGFTLWFFTLSSKPDAAAQNVRVPFIDYVKNTVSHEIYPYPEWPLEAVKANIYVVMTFALNRIYTEWYRSRGYNFDMTSNRKSPKAKNLDKMGLVRLVITLYTVINSGLKQ